MIYQLSLTFQKDKEMYILTKKKMMYLDVYCGSAFYSVILKRVVEEIFNITQLLMHYLPQFQLNLHLLLLHTKKKKKIWAGQGGQVPPLDPP